jgi:hypothetical protein
MNSISSVNHIFCLLPNHSKDELRVLLTILMYFFDLNPKISSYHMAHIRINVIDYKKIINIENH